MQNCLLIAGEEGAGAKLGQLESFGVVLHVGSTRCGLVSIRQEFEAGQVVVVDYFRISIFQICALDIADNARIYKSAPVFAKYIICLRLTQHNKSHQVNKRNL